ncbi:MAG: hypothetical protein Q4B72_02285 [Lachnospiraceae bacterium]|nr:hypothetical protein [Lachnospiraceae bacterium]
MFVIIVIVLLLTIALGRYHEKKQWMYLEKKCKEQYGRETDKKYKFENWNHIDAYFIRHRTDTAIDDITWNDLDMDKVLQKMDYTKSGIGEQALYHMLRSPLMNKEELMKREQRIAMMTDEKLRLSLQLQFIRIGHSGKYSIWDYLELLEGLGKTSNALSIAADLWIVLAIVLTVFYPMAGITALIGGVLFNFVRYFKKKGDIEPYLISFSYLMRILTSAKNVERILKEQSVLIDDAEELYENRQVFQRFLNHSYWIMSPGRMQGSSDPLELLADYLRMIFHLDLMKFNHMLGIVCSKEKQLGRIMEIMGELDASVSVACYREFLTQNGDVWSYPEFGAKKQIILEEGYHPLIDKPVVNSIETEQNILLTGSNASGKSTFLKMVAINVLFAQTIHMTLARRYLACFFRVYSSMALRDDIVSGESYYLTEIKALKRILDQIDTHTVPVLCLVDEVLRGTNTVERIAASTEILTHLSGRNMLCFAATHDIELTRLLNQDYINHHFREEIEQNEIVFSYKLYKGEAKSRNAIRLLEMIGFAPEIIQKAQSNAEQFLRTGRWDYVKE